jgi:hypothetical protein
MVARPETDPFAPPKDIDFTDVESNIHRAFSSRFPGVTHVTMTMAVTQSKNCTFPKADAQAVTFLKCRSPHRITPAAAPSMAKLWP